MLFIAPPGIQAERCDEASMRICVSRARMSYAKQLIQARAPRPTAQSQLPLGGSAHVLGLRSQRVLPHKKDTKVGKYMETVSPLKAQLCREIFFFIGLTGVHAAGF